jgi:membrane protease YdiL (CAAX protease family)
MDRHPGFPDGSQAVVILLVLFGLELLLGAAFFDAGFKVKAGDPHYGSVILVLANGVVLSLLLHYKGLGYRELFHSGGSSIKSVMVIAGLPALVAATGLFFLIWNVNALIGQLMPPSYREIRMFERMVEAGAISFAALCLVAPFLEEMLFRGIFLRSFLRRYPEAYAVGLSALLFGAMHLNLYQFVTGLVMGVFLGWIYARTQSLWPCIAIHAWNNLLAFNFSTSETTSFDRDPWFFSSLIVLALSGLALASGLLVLLRIFGTSRRTTS